MDDDFGLGLVGSEHRAAALVAALHATPTPAGKNELLREWFNACDAIGPYAEPLREEFLSAGFVTDADELPKLPATVWRACWDDSDPEQGLSWTLDRAFAEKFARSLTSIRAQFLGYYRTDARPVIWRARCPEALGYLNSRSEREIIPARLTHVRLVAILVPAGETA